MRGMTTSIAFVPDNFSMKKSRIGTQSDIRLKRLLRLFLFVALAAMAPPLLAGDAPTPLANDKSFFLVAYGSPVELAGTHGKFDFIKVDATRRRLLACHTGNSSLDVIDESSSKLIKSVPTGNAQGVAIDDKNGRYFVSVSKPPQLVIIDATKLEATGTVTLTGPADVCTYSAALNRVVVDNDDKPEQWIIDPAAQKIVQDITYPGPGMEDLAFNDDSTVLIQNLKAANLLATFDPAKGAILNQWPTAPAEKPHGLAMAGGNNVLIAGGNGKLVLLDFKAGKVLASADIAPRVDEIAYDPGTGAVYCASGTGVISVVNLAGQKLTAAGSIPSAQGAHSIAVDPKTHTVWIAFAKDDKPYVQAFTPKAP
jgi:DNA-binding beta-propeller fold protein YncE